MSRTDLAEVEEALGDTPAPEAAPPPATHVLVTLADRAALVRILSQVPLPWIESDPILKRLSEAPAVSVDGGS